MGVGMKLRKSNQPKKHLVFLVDYKLYEKIKSEAERQSVSMNYLINEILKNHFKGDNDG
jgi:predicted HicB family RNase H-like nuclease